jgi:omega-6 fatty acid desaturase (delta-12 desaturase)
LVLLAAIVAGLFQVRAFIIFHDCTHQSFWSSRKANFFWGAVTGILTFTPYRSWRKSHGIHHAHNGNLDKRGIGDVWTMTLTEYRAAGKLKRALYRLYRNPVFMFLVSPPLLFLVLHRLPEKGASRAELLGSLSTTLGSSFWVIVLGFAAGWDFVLLFGLPMVYVATLGGVWMFYVQHQFDPADWEREERWNLFDAALQGSSYYKLPRLLQWFSGNIGFHHIHHLRPRIANYRLEECYLAVQELQVLNPLTIRASLKGMFLHLWDESSQRLLSFRQAARMAI